MACSPYFSYLSLDILRLSTSARRAWGGCSSIVIVIVIVREININRDDLSTGTLK